MGFRHFVVFRAFIRDVWWWEIECREEDCWLTRANDEITSRNCNQKIVGLNSNFSRIGSAAERERERADPG